MEGLGDGRDVLAHIDDIREQVVVSGADQNVDGAGAPERNQQIYILRQMPPTIMRGVLSLEGLAGGEALVDVVGDGEVSVGSIDGVGGVVLIEVT